MEKPKRRGKAEVLLPSGEFEARIVCKLGDVGFRVQRALSVYWYHDYGKTWHHCPRKVKVVRPSDLILPGVENG